MQNSPSSDLSVRHHRRTREEDSTKRIKVGTRDKMTPYTFTNWPRQPVPNQSQKQLWKKALSRCFLQGRTNILRTQLGKWTKPTPTLPYYDPTTQITFYYKEEQRAWQSLHNLPRQLGQPLTWIQLPLLSTTPFATHKAFGTTETHGTNEIVRSVIVKTLHVGQKTKCLFVVHRIPLTVRLNVCARMLAHLLVSSTYF